MKIAYMLNSYPMTSTTFVRNEIRALEAQGLPVKRFSVRHWDGPLVDPVDAEEQRRTEYLLTGNMPALLAGALAEPLRNPRRLAAALPLVARLARAAGGGPHQAALHANYLVQAIRLKNRCRALGITHVHAHFSTNSAAVAMLAHALGGAGYSFTVHGPDELVDPARWLLAEKVARSRFTAAITDYCRGRILAEAPAGCADKVRVVRCGVDLDQFRPVPLPAPLPAPSDSARRPRRLVCVGRLCANKAQAIIPAALAAVAGDFPDARVDLLGDGEDRALIEAEVARLRLGDRVRLLGWADTDAVRAAIAGADGLLLPSLAEGLPIVVMEALATGRPVLTTAIAGIPELVDDGCGWIFPPGSTEALADALRGFLSASDEELAAKGREGRTRVEAAHDLRANAAALRAEFERAAAPAPAA